MRGETLLFFFWRVAMSDQEQLAGGAAPQPVGGEQQAAGEAQAAPDANKSDSAQGAVQVIHGANNQTFDNLAGSSVGDVRDTLAEVFNIPGDAQSLVNGENVGNNYRLKANDTLEFIKQAGVKG